MNYTELDKQLQGRNRERRKLANNTYAERRGDSVIAIRLHNTDILTYDRETGDVTVTSGGWKTTTTKNRLNEYLPNGYRIYQARGVWYWGDNAYNRIAVYADGDKIDCHGNLWPWAKPDAEKAERKLRAEISRYAKLCADAVPLPVPNGGECWGCYLRDSNGNEAMGTDHLLSHMKEKYVVPSLVLAALRERGCSNFIISEAFNKPSPEAAVGDGFVAMTREHVRRGVAKYMRRRLGLP